MNILDKQGVFSILARFATLLFGIITSILTARGLGPDGRGELTVLVTLAVSVATFSYFGFTSSTTYFISKDTKTTGRIMANNFLLCLTGALVTLMAMALSKDGYDTPYYFLLPPYVFFYMLTSFLSNTLVGLQRIYKFNLVEIVQNTVILMGYIVTYFYLHEVQYYVLSSAMGVLVGTALGIFFCKDVAKKYTIYFDKALFLKSLSYAYKVFFSTFMAYIVVRGNVFLIEKYASIDDVGHFSIALQFYDAMILVPIVIGTLLFPKLINAKGEERWNATKKVSVQVFFLMILAVAFTYFVSPYVIIELFGESFEPAILMVRMMLPAVLFYSLFTVFSQYLSSIGFPIQQVYIWVAAALIWVIMAFLVIPNHKIEGAIIVLNITYLLLWLGLFGLSYWIKKRSYEAI